MYITFSLFVDIRYKFFIFVILDYTAFIRIYLFRNASQKIFAIATDRQRRFAACSRTLDSDTAHGEARDADGLSVTLSIAREGLTTYAY